MAQLAAEAVRREAERAHAELVTASERVSLDANDPPVPTVLDLDVGEKPTGARKPTCIHVPADSA